MSKAGNKKRAGKHVSHRHKSSYPSRRSRRPHVEPDEWRDAEDERYSDEVHEPKERT